MSSQPRALGICTNRRFPRRKVGKRTWVRFPKIHSDRITTSTRKREERLKRFRCRLLQLHRSPCTFRPRENKKWLARNGAYSSKSTLKPQEVLAKPPAHCPACPVTASTMPGSGPKELVKYATRRAAPYCATNTATIAHRPARLGRTTRTANALCARHTRLSCP